MDSKNFIEWPCSKQLSEAEVDFELTSFEPTNSENKDPNNIMVYSEGWANGPIAAILRGGINAKAVLDVLASSGIREIKIYHLEETVSHLEDIFLSSVVEPAYAMFDNVTIDWRRDVSVHELVEKIGQQYSMLFFGAPLAESEVLPFYQDIKSRYRGSVTIVRAPFHDIDFDEGDEIYRWVRQQTFEAADFSFASLLRCYKRKLGKKVAVILPSLNEERTVGNVIKTALEVKGAGIIDEIILIDSQSNDNTVEIAKSYGIPTYLHADIEPKMGSHKGKGEAMFKSLFVTDADILTWVDTDIESITPSFFYGLLGPMLTNPDIRFAKGYFTRPVRVEATGLELGGGRVTEILARPWINSFLPLLSGYIQPLAGTVAIYRDEMYKMRIPTNYGVEIAMLIQALENSGLWSTCQVNLGEVIHQSKNVTSLSEMSFQIVQVLIELMGMNNVRKNDTLRRVYSAHGHFEINNKRFKTHWRNYV